MIIFDKIKQGMQKTKDFLIDGVGNLLKNFNKIDQNFLEEFEEILITSDVGVAASAEITKKLKDKAIKSNITNKDDLLEALREVIAEILVDNTVVTENNNELKENKLEENKLEENKLEENKLIKNKLKVIMLVGVNGTGKTTTAGKLAAYYKNNGKRVLLAAADTFRAAATEQLVLWSERAGVDIVKQSHGADPGAVIFDAIKSSQARNIDILICDTAGRLHNRQNLLEELRKINKIIDREVPEVPEGCKETLLVLDATTGQNGLNQVRKFNEISKINGIILTKLDGTAKGGIIIAIKKELNIPVKFIGVGEKIEDIVELDPYEFAKGFV